VTQNLAGLAATCLCAKPLVMVIAGISDEQFFARRTSATTMFVFHKHTSSHCSCALRRYAGAENILGIEANLTTNKFVRY
jgi:hypothetical protein